MEIIFVDRKLQEFCECYEKLKRKYGDIKAKKIVQRINELTSADNLFDISRLPQARLHPLSNNWKNHFAIDLNHPYRLIILPANGNHDDIKSITIIKIIKIIDYH